ncbi:MAG: gliding motility lipoprotein GldH [Chitinophagaceae bacterium]|jgi:gliding motility-associated lipoprotein GldH|nr:gliding motility lipoprotein GldH [Chitinophagaceae bacterium]
MRHKNRKIFIGSGLLFAVLCFFSACNFIGVHESLYSFSEHEWLKNDLPDVEISVIDTTASYKIFIVLRHTAAFAYNNLFIHFTSILSGDTARTQLLDLQLGDKANWRGNTLGDVIEHRIEVKNMPTRFQPGKNRFILQYEMPDDELFNIISIGVRLEKINH